MIEFESRIRESNFYNNAVELCREFRSHTSDRPLSRFNIKYSKLTITGFGQINVLKYIKSHIMTIKKLIRVLQDDLLD